MKTCARCQVTFDTWFLWNDHLGSSGCLKPVRPERTTDRTKAQIVADVEKGWLKRHLVEAAPAPALVQVKPEVDTEYRRVMSKIVMELGKAYVQP